MFSQKNKKGISVVIGYILLITSAIVISAIVYQWLRSYVPREPLECPEGVSVFLKEYKYNCVNLLNITLKNNGRFDLGGYFIRATNRSDQELATISLADYTIAGKNKGAIIFGSLNTNIMNPGTEIKNEFNLTGSGIGRIYSIEIIPVRWQEVDNEVRFVSCGGSKIKEIIDCTGEIVPGLSCSNGTCDAGETCSNCPEDCGACCGNGVIDSGEECDDNNTISGDGCSSTCKREWFVFVSSEVYDGRMNNPGLTGLAAGDKQCKTLAESSGALVKLNGRYWKAWLSTGGVSGVNAKDRIKNGVYILPNGTKIAENLNDLIDGTLLNPININEKGGIPSTSYPYVWTGTNESGMVIPGEAGQTNCNQWNDGSASAYGWKGNWSASNLNWTNRTLGTSNRKCSEKNRIYCFEV